MHAPQPWTWICIYHLVLAVALVTAARLLAGNLNLIRRHHGSWCHSVVSPLHACCRRLRALANENSLPETELTDSAIPLRLAKLQPQDEQDFFDTAATLDLRRETTTSPIGYLMQLITSIVTGQGRKSYIVNRCTHASEPDSMHTLTVRADCYMHRKPANMQHFEHSACPAHITTRRTHTAQAAAEAARAAARTRRDCCASATDAAGAGHHGRPALQAAADREAPVIIAGRCCR